MMTKSSVIVIDAPEDINTENLPSQKTLARTDEELKKCPIFTSQFLNEVLKEAQSDAEKQFILNAFQESLNGHGAFTFRLLNIDWFLEKYYGMFNKAKDIVTPDSILQLGPQTQQNPSPKANKSKGGSIMNLKYEPLPINNNLTFPIQPRSLINTFPMIEEPKVPCYVNDSFLTQAYTISPMQYSENPIYSGLYNPQNITREQNKEKYAHQRPNHLDLSPNSNQKTQLRRKEKDEKTKSGKEILLRVKDYLENVLGEVRKMCEMDGNSINPEDVIKLLTDRISMFK